MGNVINFGLIDKLRKRSAAHAAIVEILESPAGMSADSSASDWADYLMESLWLEGFKIVPRDDGGGAA